METVTITFKKKDLIGADDDRITLAVRSYGRPKIAAYMYVSNGIDNTSCKRLLVSSNGKLMLGKEMLTK